MLLRIAPDFCKTNNSSAHEFPSPLHLLRLLLSLQNSGDTEEDNLWILFHSNLLTLNCAKSKFLLFGSRKHLKSFKVCMKWKLSLSYLNELLKWYRNSIYSFSISLFVLVILRFVWYVNNTLHTSRCIMSCWETMHMIEITLLNQSKLSLLGVIRQISLHAQVRVTLFDNFNDISTFTTSHYLMWRILFTYQTNRNISRTSSDMEKL